jgi:hypothetical protein
MILLFISNFSCDKIINKKKVWEELISYFPLYDTGGV